ncbi:hypothetical protein BOX15_Mlig029252g1, partial [Macrostomum lignano]
SRMASNGTNDSSSASPAGHLSMDERLEIFLEANLVASLIDNVADSCTSADCNTNAVDNLLLDPLASRDCANNRVVRNRVSFANKQPQQQKHRRRGTYELNDSQVNSPPPSWLLDKPEQDLNRTFCLVESNDQDKKSPIVSSENKDLLSPLNSLPIPATRQSASSRSSYATARSSLSPPPMSRLVEVEIDDESRCENEDDAVSSDVGTMSPPLPPPPQELLDNEEIAISEFDDADRTLVPQQRSQSIIASPALPLPSRLSNLDATFLRSPAQQHSVLKMAVEDSDCPLEQSLAQSEVLATEPDGPELGHTVSGNFPEVLRTKPEVSSDEPEDSTAKSEVSSGEPEVSTAKPEESTTKPEESTTKPEESTTKPELSADKPEVLTAELDDSTAKPEVSSTKPENSTAKLEVSSAKPEISPAKPEVSSAKPEDSTAKLEVSSAKPEISSGLKSHQLSLKTHQLSLRIQQLGLKSQ